jgi:hypothetical protein
VWDSETRTPLATCNQKTAFTNSNLIRPSFSTEWVRDSRFGSDAHTILSVGAYGAWIWKWSEGKDDCSGDIIRLDRDRGRNSGDIRTGAFSPDLKSVVTTSDDGSRCGIWKRIQSRSWTLRPRSFQVATSRPVRNSARTESRSQSAAMTVSFRLQIFRHSPLVTRRFSCRAPSCLQRFGRTLLPPTIRWCRVSANCDERLEMTARA